MQTQKKIYVYKIPFLKFVSLLMQNRKSIYFLLWIMEYLNTFFQMRPDLRWRDGNGKDIKKQIINITETREPRAERVIVRLCTLRVSCGFGFFSLCFGM